ncbi:SLC13 family permease [Arenibaculum pallidiluteum]|uniref:SLC13 family permease n=1 Tax=Arenibaculum pallidiluteum TaxID=2812559 RepID=UPI001A97832B|nr:SLC13 family permease [Arenibaculum pallidiluteum]
MSPEMISIYVLAAMFVIATLLPINMGVLAFVGAYLVGTLVAGLSAKDIIAGFPAGLFLTLVGITYLFALAQNNGTIDWLVQLAVRAVRGRIAAIPWIMFGIAALLTAVGAVSPGAVAIIAPVALGFALKYGISPLLMGLMVIHGAQAGGFSPISIYGGITNRIVAQAGLPLNEIATFLASFGVNAAVAAALFFVLGGRSLLAQSGSAQQPGFISGRAMGQHMAMTLPPTGAFARSDVGQPALAGALSGTASGTTTGTRPAEVAVPQSGAQIYGEAEAEAFGEERDVAKGGHASVLDAPAADAEAAPRAHQVLTLLALAALAILTLGFNLDIGFVAITLGLFLSLLAPNMQKRAIGQVTWPEVMLITGVSTYVGVLQTMGTIDFVGHSVAGLASPMTAALLLCLIGAVVSAFASSVAVLGSLIPLAVPFLQSGSGVEAVGFIAAMAVSSTIVDVSPFSTNGALVLASARGVDREAFFRSLLGYGALVTVAAPVVVWLLFVML